jgi:hypothetical protein
MRLTIFIAPTAVYLAGTVKVSVGSITAALAYSFSLLNGAFMWVSLFKMTAESFVSEPVDAIIGT